MGQLSKKHSACLDLGSILNHTHTHRSSLVFLRCFRAWMFNISVKLIFFDLVFLPCPNFTCYKTSCLMSPPVFYLFVFSISSSACNSPNFFLFMFSSSPSLPNNPVLSSCAFARSQQACIGEGHAHTPMESWVTTIHM